MCLTTFIGQPMCYYVYMLTATWLSADAELPRDSPYHLAPPLTESSASAPDFRAPHAATGSHYPQMLPTITWAHVPPTLQDTPSPYQTCHLWRGQAYNKQGFDVHSLTSAQPAMEVIPDVSTPQAQQHSLLYTTTTTDVGTISHKRFSIGM